MKYIICILNLRQRFILESIIGKYNEYSSYLSEYINSYLKPNQDLSTSSNEIQPTKVISTFNF